MLATVRCPGTCGEFVQGTLEGNHLLVTCPVNRYSQVTVELISLNDCINGLDSHPKTKMAVRSTLDRLGLFEYGANVLVESGLPEGKGMASSTADIAAAVMAVAVAAGRPITYQSVADIALEIEPSDGVMHPGIWLFDHISGKIRKRLGGAIPLTIIALDPGGLVDTLAFNAREDLALKNKNKEGLIREALELVRMGFLRGDPDLIGRGATISARANQETLFKPLLEDVLEYAQSLGAVGVNIAHSGTVIGVLFPQRDDSQHLIDHISRRFPDVKEIAALELVDGGVEVAQRR